MDAREVAEAFHLAYLVALQAAAHPRTWALKGGGNLRFYYDSPRLSEDIDLDAFIDDPRLFHAKVEKAFGSAGLTKLLASLGMAVHHLNPRDRTATKERWTIGLRHPDVAAVVYTQLEVSYRAYGLEAYVVIEIARSSVAARYAPVPPPTIGHYVPRGAVIQKITALKDRRHTQPRDVFDLDHLFRRFPDAPAMGLLSNEDLDRAIDRVFELDFPTYHATVAAFFEPSVATAYDSQDAWGQMQVRVVEILEQMRT